MATQKGQRTSEIELFIGPSWKTEKVGCVADDVVYRYVNYRLEPVAKIAGCRIMVGFDDVGGVLEDNRTVEKGPSWQRENNVGLVDEDGVVYSGPFWKPERIGEVRPASASAGAALLLLFSPAPPEDTQGPTMLQGAAVGAGGAAVAAASSSERRGSSSAQGSDQIATILRVVFAALALVFVASYRKAPRATVLVTLCLVFGAGAIALAISASNKPAPAIRQADDSRSLYGPKPVLAGDQLGVQLSTRLHSNSSSEIQDVTCPTKDLFDGDIAICTVYYESGSALQINVSVSGTTDQPHVEISVASDPTNVVQ